MDRPARLSRATILIVESEAIIGLELAHWLAKLGSVALLAIDAEEAMAILEANPDIRLLITDIRMRGSMDGVHLAHQVRSHWPMIKIVVVSGFINTQPSDLPKQSLFIPKPYKPQDVWAAMSRLAPGRGPRPPTDQAFLPF
jgi:DNA-binding NtrC family response regulator